MEELGRRGLTDVLYSKVAQLSGSRRRSKGKKSIKDGNGVLLTEEEKIKSRWKEYVEALYDKNGKPASEDMEIEERDDVDNDEIGAELLKEEVIRAINDMRENKAVGVDDIPAEFLKRLGSKGTQELVNGWITNEMLDKMEERRRYKNVNTDVGRQMYRSLNNELRRETNKAREAWWESECKEMEELGRRGLTDVLYSKVAELSGSRRRSKGKKSIKDGNG